MRNAVLAALLLVLASGLSAQVHGVILVSSVLNFQTNRFAEGNDLPFLTYTPFFGTEYTLSHLGVPESLRGNLRIEEYEAGHMMYIHEGSLAKMKSDITSFYQETKSMSGRGVANVPGGR